MDNDDQKRGLGWWIIRLGALAAAVTAIVTLWSTFFPEPGTYSGDLSDVTMEHGVTFGDYQQRANQPVDTRNQALNNQFGIAVNFVAEIQGYKDKECQLRWSLFDATTQTRYPDRRWSNVVAGPLVPESSNDRASRDVWIPVPDTRGQYFVRLELYDPDGSRLDYADSSAFNRN